MALNFDGLKARLAKSQEKGGGKKDYSKIYYKPVIGKQKIRIVPWKEDKTNPFIEVQLHKYDTFKKYIPTLANFGEKDPILKFREKVFKDVTSTEEDKAFMKNFTPKNGIFVQVVVRGKKGEPDSDLILWELNKTNFEAVALIAADGDEYGDITDIVSGRDLIVEGYTAVNEKTKKTYTAVNISVSVNQTKLSDDKERVKKLLTEQLSPIEQYKRLTAEEISSLLENFLNPADGSADEDDEPVKAVAPKAPAKAPVAKQKFVKLEEVAVEDDPELAEDPELVESEPVVKPKATLKPKAKTDDLPFDVPEEDELSDVIPNTPPAKAVVKTKILPKAAATKPLTIAKKFDALYEDDDE